MLTEPREAQPRTSTFKLIAGDPAMIDLTTTYKGDAKALHTKAIYKIENDVLTYCVSSPDQPRPSEFATRKGDGSTLVVLKRVLPK